MRSWTPERVADAAGARLVAAPEGLDGGPSRAVIDSREAGPSDLFFGLVGEHTDGGRFAADVLAAGAWGVVVRPEHASDALTGGTVLAADDPLLALQQLANAWRRALGAQVIGVTGSAGKTSTKDVLAAMVAQQKRTVATHANFNTEIGLPLTVLGAPEGTEVLVLEMAMRGAGQIAELARIAEPDVAVITNIGPAHLEQMGSLEAIAAEKSAIVAGLKPGGTAIVPRDEPLLQPHLRDDVTTVTFGPGDALGGIEIPFTSAHMRLNATAALAAARAVGVEPHGAVDVALTDRRGERIALPGDVTVVNDCYNANPMSMRAALDDLAVAATGRRVAVLGDMLELGPDSERFHREIGDHARAQGVDLLITVGPRAVAMQGDHAVADAGEAAALVPELLQDGDTVLVKASRGVGLWAVTEALTAAAAR
ncbi:MAG TPA: UDP-N-acetylmuramoyl-tripeptide--D-alanyl-D-alanine ligase [Solirubrobacteraceae bacterium]|nr:UDP-N-acetylmuramoyl-tripeptide--D-alanyl-D-alanine ligase [Solirubrobacteraceae bacterium]